MTQLLAMIADVTFVVSILLGVVQAPTAIALPFHPCLVSASVSNLLPFPTLLPASVHLHCICMFGGVGLGLVYMRFPRFLSLLLAHALV